MRSARQYWLMKSEPAVFSFDDLKARPRSTDHWEGVRNYQARKYMRQMRKRKAEALIKLQRLESVARYNRAILEDALKLIEGGG